MSPPLTARNDAPARHGAIRGRQPATGSTTAAAADCRRLPSCRHVTATDGTQRRPSQAWGTQGPTTGHRQHHRRCRHCRNPLSEHDGVPSPAPSRTSWRASRARAPPGRSALFRDGAPCRSQMPLASGGWFLRAHRNPDYHRVPICLSALASLGRSGFSNPCRLESAAPRVAFACCCFALLLA